MNKIVVATNEGIEPYRKKYYNVNDLDNVIDNLAEMDNMASEYHGETVKTHYHVIRSNAEISGLEAVDPYTGNILWARERLALPPGVKAILVAENEDAWDMLTHDIDMMSGLDGFGVRAA